MPQQMRGFWVCDYCHAGFDGPDQARYHEEQDCPSRRGNGHGQQQAAEGGDDDADRRKSRIDYSAAAPLNDQIHPPLEGFHPVMSPVRSDHSVVATAAAVAEEALHLHQDPVAQPHLEQQQQSARRHLLLEPQDASQHHELSHADSVACQNLQLFQDSLLSASDQDNHDTAAPFRVGLVCRRCSSLGARLSDGELSMPRSIASLADAVYSMAERHLQTCELLPSEERLVIQQAVQLRQARQAEGGAGWQEEEAYRRVLVEFVKSRCFQLGIMNRYPENSGICYAETEEAAVRAAPVEYASQALPLQEAEHEEPRQRRTSPSRSEAKTASPARHHGVSVPPLTDQEAYAAVPPVSHLPHHRVAPPFDAPFAPPTYLSPEALAMRQAAAVAAVTMDPHAAAAAAAVYPPAPPIELPPNFPYFQDPYEGDWLCKYCSHIHPQYRDLNYRWSTPDRTPPPGDFIDHHLSICRAYIDQQQQMSEYYQQQQLATEPHSPYSYGHTPQDVAYPTTAMAAGYAPHARLNNPEISPMTPVTAYAPAYDGPPMPLVGLHQPHELPNSYAAHAHEAAVAAASSPGKMGPAVRSAVQFLAEQDRFARLPDDQNLVRLEDKLLLTDFLYYLMKQLQVVRFSEGDRKTRGGKRENINLGFGGLQCVHCADTQKSRKFYWSGVDRLANSFAEIPSHVFKCQACPEAVKDALSTLKEIHPDQMSRLPRGSQKVFFRRVWKRIHEDDPPPTADSSPPVASRIGDAGNQVSPSDVTKQTSPSGTTATSGSEGSPYQIERPTKDAARALAEAAMHLDSLPISPSSRVLLAIAEDRDYLSEQDCFVRRQLEVFCATTDDIRTAAQDSKFPIEEGQVGIRCVHCSMAQHGPGATGNAVIYPYSVNGIYEAVREFQRVHLKTCDNFPSAWKTKLGNMNEASTISSIQRKYFSLAAKGLGLKDTRGGIRAGSESVPVVSHAVFSFADSDAMGGWGRGQEQVYSEKANDSFGKRKLEHDEDHDDEPELKRTTSDRSAV